MKEAERKIIMKFARPHRWRTDFPMKCKPSEEERRTGRRAETMGSDWKIIYPSQELAEACARELETVGVPPQRAYPCRRSRKGHFHLTTRGADERPVKRCVPGT